ncbi:hypothetical protein [Viscerimonas tarda]
MKTKLLRQIRRIYHFEFHRLIDEDFLYVASDYLRRRVVVMSSSHSLAIMVAEKVLGKAKMAWLLIRRIR